MRSIVSTLATCATVAAMIACESNGPADPTLQFARVSLNQRAVDVGIDEQQQLTLSSTEPGSAVTWQSADPSVATVTSSGVVSGRKIGSTMVIAAAKKSSDTATIVVHTPISSLAFPYELTTLSLGNGSQLTFIAYDKAGKMVQFSPGSARWTSLSQGIVSVTSTGFATGRSLGTATIRIDMNGKTATTSVQVVQIPIASISVTPTPTTLNVGGKKQLQAIVKDSAGNTLQNRTINWTSSDTLVADVTGTGTVTALGTGTTTITATSEGKLAAATVTANPAVVVSVGVTLNAGNIQVGQTTQAVATARDSAGNGISGRAVTWASSNPSVATVSSQGVVTAVANGSTSVKATVDGVSGSANLTVSTAVVSSVGVTLGSSSLVAGSTTQATAVASDALGNAITGRSVAWSTSNSAIATVSNLGLVTAVAGGTVSITATVDGVQGSATLVVTAPSVASVTVTVGSSSLIAGQTTQASAVAKDASGNVLNLSVTWSSTAPTVASVSASGTVSALNAGSTSITATVAGKSGSANVSVQSTAPAPTGSSGPNDAALPQVYLTTTVASTPSAGRTLRVAAGGNLQRALDTAVAGDKILLAAGATFVGNFTIGPKAGGLAGGWITVMSDGQLPAEGTRVSPAMASTMAFPKLVSPGLISTLITQGPATRWRFIGLEITVDPSVTMNQGLVLAGDASSVQNSSDKVPSDLIFDRIYAHGQPALDLRKCFAFNAASTALIDSYVSECHSTFDAQAVTGTNGPGPFKIVNNYLEAAAENISWGGAPVWIANMVPADFEIRRNYISKPLAWKSTWLTKNLIEFKVGRRILIEGNVLENSPVAAQPGWAFVLWSATAQVGCSWCITEDVTIRNNLIRNVAGGFSLTKSYDATSQGMQTVTIRNNVIIGLDNPAVGSNGRIFQITGDIPNITIEHNTGFSPTNASLMWDATALSNHIVRDNVLGGGDYQLFAAGVGLGVAAWNKVGGPGSILTNNVIALAPEGSYPASNFYPKKLDGIGLVGGDHAAYATNAALNDLGLLPSSPYKGKAGDGRDPGADISLLSSAIAGVIP